MVSNHAQNSSPQSWRYRESTRWSIVIILTIVVALFNFFGPDIHSEVKDATTLLSETFGTLIFFVISGAFLLPVKKGNKWHINNCIIIVALLFFIYRFLLLAIYLFPYLLEGKNLSSLIVVLIFILGIIFLFFKIKKIRQ